MLVLVLLFQDYMKLDVLTKMDGATAAGDEKLRAAWEAASQFKKRYMEHKAELDTIRLAAARMQVGPVVGPTYSWAEGVGLNQPWLDLRLTCTASATRSSLVHLQAQLDETHKLLHDEHKARFKLEDDNTRLKLELGRLKV